MESYVPLSALRGGSTRFRREDLVAELAKEDELMAAYLRLNTCDRSRPPTPTSCLFLSRFFLFFLRVVVVLVAAGEER